MRLVVLISVCLGLLAGCSGTKNPFSGRQKVSFSGHSFRTSLKAVREDPQMFDVTVRGATKSLEAAEDAGRYEATRHCVTRYGNSKLEWMVVVETQERDVKVDQDTLVMRGRCEA